MHIVHVLVHLLKSFRGYDVKSSSTVFSDNIQWKFHIMEKREKLSSKKIEKQDKKSDSSWRLTWSCILQLFSHSCEISIRALFLICVKYQSKYFFALHLIAFQWSRSIYNPLQYPILDIGKALLDFPIRSSSKTGHVQDCTL